MASSLWGLRQTEDEQEMARRAAAEMAAVALTDPALPAAGAQKKEVESTKQVESAEMPDLEGEVEVDVDEEPEVTGELPDPDEEETMGVGEHARGVIRQETGKRADQILNGGDDLYTRMADLFGVSREGSAAAMTHVAPFGRQMAKTYANIEERNLGRLLDNDYSNEELDDIVRASGDSLRRNDEEIRRMVQGDVDPVRSRRMLLQQAAEGDLYGRAEKRQGAEKDLNNRERTGWGKFVGGALENSGYVNSFVYGSTIMGGLGLGFSMPTGVATKMAAARLAGKGTVGALGTLTKGELGKYLLNTAANTALTSMPVTMSDMADEATRMMKDDYSIDAQGELQRIDNNYGDLRSILQGGGKAVVSDIVIEGLTDTAVEVGLLGLSKMPGVRTFLVKPLSKMTSAAARKMMGSPAGRTLLKIGKGYNALEQITHHNSLPVETLEEYLDPINEITGLSRKRGEWKGVGGEFADYKKNMLSWKGLNDTVLQIAGTCLVQGAGGAALNLGKKYAPNETTPKEARSVLTDYAGVAKEKVSVLSDEDAIALANKYMEWRGNPEKLQKDCEALGKVSEAIVGDIISKGNLRMNQQLEERGIPAGRFQIPMNGNEIAFQSEPGTDSLTGKPIERKFVEDTESCVRIYDNGPSVGDERRFSVYDPVSGESIDVANLKTQGVEIATIFKNNKKILDSDRANKAFYINRVRDSRYGNSVIKIANTSEEAIEYSLSKGVDVVRQARENELRYWKAQNGGKELTAEETALAEEMAMMKLAQRRAWRLNNGQIVFVSDNIKTPYEVNTLFQHEIIGHNADAMADEFMSNLDSKTMDAAMKQMGLTKEQMADPVVRREVFANIIQQRRHNPSMMQKIKHFINEKRRASGETDAISDADVEVMAQKWEQAEMGDAGETIPPDAPKSHADMSINDVATPTTEAEPEVAEVPEAEEEVAEVDGEIPETEAIEPAAPAPQDGQKARDFMSVMHDGGTVTRMEIGKIALPDTQFKEGADPKTGVVRGQELQGEYYESAENAVVGYVHKDGSVELVTGRHRFDLAKRNGKKDILIRLFKESDGYTKDDMRNLDAVSNIIDEKGSVKDYVKYFDEAKTDRATAEKKGFLSRKKGNLAFNIHEGATDDTKATVDWSDSGTDGMISTEQAGIISEAAPKDGHPRNKALQRILVTKALNGLRGKKLAIVARSLAEEVKTAKTGGGAGGEMQLDLFTSAEDLELLALEDKRAEYRIGKAGEYTRIAEVLRTAMSKGGKLDLNAEYAKELEITDPKDKKQLEKACDRAVERANYWENAIRLNAEDKAAMDAAIEQSASKASGKKTEISDKLKGIVAKSVKRAGGGKDAEKSTTNAETGTKNAVPKEKSAEKTVKKPNVELTEQEKAQSAANAAFSALTGIPVVQVGANGQVLSDSTPAAEAAISGKKPDSEDVLVANLADEELVKEYHALKSSGKDVGKVGKELAKRGIYSSKKTSVVPYRDDNGQPRVGFTSEITSYFTKDGNTIAKFDAGEEKAAPAETAQKAEKRSVAASVKMKDEASEKKAEAQEDALAALFSTSELDPYKAYALSGDEIRKEMPGYDRLDYKTHVDRTGFVGPRMEEKFQRLLKERKGKGNGSVVFLAGGNGAGKSTFAKRIGGTPDFVIDSTLGNIDVARKQIDAILANGQKPVIAFVYRKPWDALTGIVNRMENGGHIVSPLSFANSHTQSRDNLRLLYDEYGGKIDVRIYDNSVPGAPLITIDELEKKEKPDHAKLRKNADFYLEAARGRLARQSGKGSVRGSGETGGKEEGGKEVSFASSEFDPKVFQARVGAVAELAKTYVDSGVGNFKTLATRMAARFPDKFGNMKPYLRSVWNAVAEQMDLEEVSKNEAEAVYAEAEKAYNTQTKGETNERGEGLRQHRNADDHELPASAGVQAEGGNRAAEGGDAVQDNPRPGEGGADSAVSRGENGNGSRVSVERPKVADGAFPAGGAEGQRKGAEGSTSVAQRDGRGVQADGRGVEGSKPFGSVESGTSSDVGGRSGGSGGVAASVQKTVSKELPNTVQNENYIITDSDELAIENSSPREKSKSNVEAIRIVRKLEEDGRPATEDEKQKLARYVGWGGLAQVFDTTYERAYEREQNGETLPPQTWAAIRKTSFGEEGYNLYKQLRDLLTPEEIAAAKESTTSAFFSPIRLCRAVHKALAKAGLTGGRLLETSAGIGNLIGTGNYVNPRWTAVELDKVSGQILKALYPNANVRIQGFEDVQITDNFMDGVISNVPFGTSHPYDANYKKYGFVIHDFFFAKAVDKLHPGGVAALITDPGTLDKRDKKLIRYLSEHGGKIAGAVRLPNGLFKKNAGTDVATDVVFIQKVDGTADNATFLEATTKDGCPISKWFLDHPELCLGKPTAGTDQWGNPKFKYVNSDLTDAQIEDAVVKASEGLVFKSVDEAKHPSKIIDSVDSNSLSNGNVGVVGDQIVQKLNGELVAVPKDDIPKLTQKLTKKGVTPQKLVRAVESLRNAYRAVVDGQMSNCSDAELKKLQQALDYEYSTFCSRYGHPNDFTIKKFVRLDLSTAPMLLALETDNQTKVGDKVKHIYTKSDIFTKRTIFATSRATKADNVADGLRISLNETGGVDTKRIAELTGKDEATVRQELMDSGRVFVNPETSGLETRDEYLSGSVRRKLKAAKAAAEIDPSFKKNVEELEKVQPEDIAATDISYQLGQNWIPQDIYEQFFKEAVYRETAPKLRVSFDSREHLWHVDKATGQTEWDEESGLAIEDLLERTMNGQSIVVRRKVGDNEYVIDQPATTATKIVQEKIAKEFQSWMTDDIERANRLERLYNDVMNDNVQREFDTDVLEMQGLSEEWAKRLNTSGREYQKRCIARGTLGGNLLIAHCVGAGKTFEMASICMQLRRLGIARKPMFVVPGHMLAQWNREFHEAYPGAKVLVADPKKDLLKDNRRSFLARVANGDWDCVVVAHSTFSRIAMSPEHQAEYVEREIADLEDVINRTNGERGNERKQSVKKIQKKLQSLRDKLKSLLDPSKKDDAIRFEETGCDYLFIDEAHNFKGLNINTHMSNVPGVTGSVSQRAQDLEMKCRYISKIQGGNRGVVFATGTPISNSISEMYVMMRYLAPTKMDDMGVRSFDDWAKQFGQVVNEWSPNPSGVGFREKARFSQFQNVPEMKRFFRSFADIVLDGDLNIKRPKPIEKKHVMKPTSAQKSYVTALNDRMEKMQSTKVDPTVDNMLKVTTEGRLLAIDPALIGVKDDAHSRANAAADEVKRIYDESTGKIVKDRDGNDRTINGTQLIFCDSGVPKKKQFKELVRDAAGNYQLASGYWNFTVTAPDAYGARQAYGKRVDGMTVTFSAVSDHSVDGFEDLASVYSALEGLAMKADAVNTESKLGKGTKKAKKVDGEAVDINGWIDMNSERMGYDPRFTNPYAQMTLDEAAPDTEEEQEAADDADTSEEANGDAEVDNMLRGKFNMYAELRKQIIRRGIPAEEIAFIHDAETMTQKQALFDRVKKGQVRVLIGNTAKMGEGTNVQDMLVAIHHLDIPWKPAWITQRDGRGIRSGNLNDSIEIHKYITEGTFDVYSWDTVGRKAKFIENAMNARMDQRIIEDADSTVMSLEEGKAAAAGDPRILERVKLIKAVEKKQMEFDTQVKASDRAKLKLRVAESDLLEAEKKTAKYTEAIKAYNAAKGDKPFTFTTLEDTPRELTDNTEIARAIQDKLRFFARKGSDLGTVGRVFGFDVRYSRDGSSAKIEIKEIGVEMPVTILPGRGAAFPPTDLSKFKTQITNHTSERALQGFDDYLVGYKKRVDVAKKGVENVQSFDRDAASGEIGGMYVTLAKLNNALGIKDKNVLDKALAHAQQNGMTEEIAALSEKKDGEAPGAEFSTEELDPKKVGIAKADIERQARSLGRVPFRPRQKTWPEVYQRSEAMLNQTGFIEGLVEDAAKYARPLTAEQTLAVGEYQLVLGQQYSEIHALRQETENDLANSDPSDTEYITGLNESLKAVKEEESKIAARYATCYKAFRMSKAEQGRALAANRAQFSEEFDFLGMKEARQAALGRDLTPEEMKNLHDLCDRARDLDEDARAELWAAVNAQAEKTIKDLFFKDGVKRSGTSRGGKLTDYRKKYLDAMKHLEIYRDTVGGSLIGITGDEYGTWNKPIFDLLLYHRFVNPDITASEALRAVTEDVNTYIAADQNTVARILTGFERSWDINRHDEVLKGGRDLRSQILTQLQIEKLLGKEMPGKTGPIQADPSEDLRNLRHTRDVLKNDLAEETGDPRKLQSRQKRWMKWYDNRIEDLKREIAAGERLPQSKKTLEWTDEMKAKRAEYEALVAERDRVCGPKLTEEERVKLYEKSLEKTLRRAIEKLQRAKNDDFRKPSVTEKPTSEYIESLKKAIEETNAEFRQEKKDRLNFGRTQEELRKFNDARERTRTKRVQYWQALTAPNADRTPVKRPPIPMPPEQQARYDELGKQMKKLRRQVMDMRAHDELMKKPWPVRNGIEYLRFVNGLTRGFLATADHSAVLRQMAQLSQGHPILAAQVFKNTVGTAFSDEKARKINDEYLSDPRIREAVDKGWLAWRNLEAEGGVNDVEMFSTLHSSAITIGRNPDGTEKRLALDDIKGVGSVLRGSERIYASYINALSAEIYLALTNADGFTAKLLFGQNGLTDFTKKEIAARINMANGSAQIDDPRKKQFMNQLTGIFWAPKLALSRAQLALGWDILHPLFTKEADVKTRLRTAAFNAIEHGRAKLAMIALGTLMLMLAGDGDDKEKWRRASLFQKFIQSIKPRVGATTLDFSGGEVGWYQLLAKWVTLQKETGTGRTQYLAEKDGHKKSFGTSGVIGETFRFAQGKFNPLLSNAIALWTGEDYTGQPFGLGDLAVNTFVPLGASDITNAFVENGLGRGLLLSPFIIFGAGGNTYPVKRYDVAVNQFAEAAKAYDEIRESRDLDADEKSDMLQELQDNVPELRSRARIEAKIGTVKYFEKQIRALEKLGVKSIPKSLTEGRDKAKEETLELIRKSR